jgi:hypothetical protein
VCWNQPFKAKLRQLFDEWMMDGEKPLTKGGNPRPPSPDVYLEWILTAWEAVSVETIKKSFKAW